MGWVREGEVRRERGRERERERGREAGRKREIVHESPRRGPHKQIQTHKIHRQIQECYYFTTLLLILTTNLILSIKKILLYRFW